MIEGAGGSGSVLNLNLISLRKFFGGLLSNAVTIKSLMQSLIPGKLGEAVSNLPDEWVQMSERDYVDTVMGGWENISPHDHELRRNFWTVYPKAIFNEDPISIEAIYDGVISKPGFYSVVSDPKRVCFITKEPASDALKSQHLLNIGWRRIEEILSERPQRDKHGKPDTKLMDLQARLWEYLYERKHGKMVQTVHQKVDQKTLQVNVDGNKALPTSDHLTPQEVDRRLAELENKVALPPAQPVPEVLDAVTHQERELLTTCRSVMDDKRS